MTGPPPSAGVLCPCCGRPMDALPPLEHLVLTMAPQGHVSRRIIKALVDAYPRAICGPRLHDIIYADDPDGGPLCNSVSVLMIRLRKKLRPYGWTVPHVKKGRYSQGYRLAPLETK